ncbi:MAG: hypothetical protein ACPF8V_10520, partial [Luteibaculum sp.]
MDLNHCSFNGLVKVISGRNSISNSTFFNRVDIEKTGENFDSWKGGNRFAEFYLTNSGSGTSVLGDGQADEFNGPIHITNIAGGNIYLWHRNSVSQLNQDLILSAVKGKISTGLAGGAAQLNNDSEIIIQSTEADSGDIDIKFLSQPLEQDQKLEQLGSGALYLDSCNFKGDVELISPQPFVQGSVFERVLRVTKTAQRNSISAGGNRFMAPVYLSNLDSGILGSGNGNPDLFLDSLILNSSGSGGISLSYKSMGNEIHGPILLNASSGTIRFGFDTSSTRITNKIIASTSTFNEAELALGRCTLSLGNALVLNLGKEAKITLGPESVFEDELEIRAGSFSLDASRFKQNTSFIKTSLEVDNGKSGSVFEKDLSVRLTGAGIFQLSYKDSGDQFLGDIYLQAGLGTIRFGTQGGLTKILSGNGIYNFPDEEFSGNLFLGHVSSEPGAEITLVGEEKSKIFFGPNSRFDHPLDIKFGAIGLNQSTFNQSCTLENIGNEYLISEGESSFQDTAIFKQLGTSTWGFQRNTYYGPTYFSVAEDSANFFTGKSVVGASVYFTDTSTARLNLFSDTLEFIGESPSAHCLTDSLQFVKHLVANTDGGEVKLFGSFFLESSLTLNSGVISYQDQPLTLGPSVVSSPGNNLSYINGGVRKKGGVDFLLPLGGDGKYQPIGFFKNSSDGSEIEVSFIPKSFREDFSSVSIPSEYDFISDCGYYFISNPEEKIIAPVVYAPRDSFCFPLPANDLTPIGFLGSSFFKFPNSQRTPSNAFYITEADSSINQNFILLVGSAENFRPFAYPLLYFVVYKAGDMAKIEFSTAFEKDNDFYELQRAINQEAFVPRDSIFTTANSSEEQTYVFSDSLGAEGIYSYRIRQVNKFG